MAGRRARDKDQLMNYPLKIVPHRGFADVHFGMKRPEVLAELGDPQNVGTAFAGRGAQDIEWFYSELGVTLCFCHEDAGALGAISFESENATLWGSRPIDMPIHSFLDAFAALSSEILLFEDEYPELDAKDYWCDALGLLIYVESGVISRVSIFSD